jgi:hypothetical protein
MGEERRRQDKDVEGPEPGTPAMENLVREAEEKGQENVADDADEEQQRERDEDSENRS